MERPPQKLYESCDSLPNGKICWENVFNGLSSNDGGAMTSDHDEESIDGICNCGMSRIVTKLWRVLLKRRVGRRHNLFDHWRIIAIVQNILYHVMYRYCSKEFFIQHHVWIRRNVEWIAFE
jgi:hypothetical protein